MRKWKKYLAAAFVATLTVGTMSSIVPGRVEKVQAADETVTATLPLDDGVVWKYSDDNTDPAGDEENANYNRTSWTVEDFDDSEWKTNEGNTAIFGVKSGTSLELDNGYTATVLLNHYIDGSAAPVIPAYFFRTKFNLEEIPADQNLECTLTYDDAVIVYLNGEKVANFPDESEISTEAYKQYLYGNMNYGGTNATNPITETFTIDSSMLKEGVNTLAVELHNGRSSSSDAYFTMSSLAFAEEDSNDITQKAVSLTVGADETSRNINWYADTETAGSVQYAVKDGDEFPADYKTVEATASKSNDTSEGIFYSNKATLDGLEANTEYVYRLVNGETVSEMYSFKTTGTGDFSFLLVGDPQIGASGNATTDATNWRNTLSTAFTQFPDSAFLLSAGDQVNTASNETEYAGYLESDVLKSLSTATVIGNHDSSSNAYSQHFNNPNVSAYGASTAGTDYWFVYNNVLVMSLNSNWSTTSVAEHQAFMKEAIEANPDVDWKVVTFHHSIYSAASHATQSDILSRRDLYVPVFTELDIDVVMMGHDHVYVRSYMMDALTAITDEEYYDECDDNGIPVSVTNPDDEILYVTVNSASGSKYYNITADYSYSAVQNQERTPNFTNVEVTDTSFKVTTYRTTDLTVVDEFTIYREDETTKTVEAATKTTGYENESEGTSLAITKTAEYDSGEVNADGGSAEIVQYNSDNQMYYVVNGTTGTLDIVPREVYTEDNQVEGIKFNLKTKLINYRTDFVYGDMTSVAVNTEKDLIAIAVQAAGTNDNGLIVLMNYNNEIVAVIDAGVQPDMVTFTNDGSKVLSANEGEPRDGYEGDAIDPMGTITVADLSNLEAIAAQNITFESWDASREELVAAGVVIKKNTAPSVDFEPEYIAVNSTGTLAYVALQEANAIAVVDLTTNTVTAINSMGFKDHSAEGNALDMAKDDTINIQNEDVYGIYMPDGITIYEVNGVEYLLTANEGDSREWGTYLNETEVKINGSKVVTLDTSDYDGLSADKTYLFGGRSFSIYNAATMEQVYDSGSDFEAKTAEYLAEYFNCSNDKISLDNRSGKKGPEAESVVVGTVGDKTYAFIGLERIGGIMIYDITDPANTTFVNYINSRDFSENISGDVSPEGLTFVPASKSASGNAELIVAHEVSGTVAIYELTALSVETDDDQDNDDNQDNNDDQDNDDNQDNSDDQDNNNGQENDDSQNSDVNQGEDNNQNTDDSQNSSTSENKGANADKTEIVDTGDDSHMILWISIMLASMMMVIGVAVTRKRMK